MIMKTMDKKSIKKVLRLRFLALIPMYPGIIIFSYIYLKATEKKNQYFYQNCDFASKSNQ